MKRTIARSLFTLSILALASACGDEDPSPNAGDTADAGSDSGSDAAASDASGADASGADTSGADAPDSHASDIETDVEVIPNGTCVETRTLEQLDDNTWIAEGTTRFAPSELDGTCSEEDGPEQVYSWVSPSTGVAVANLDGQDPLLHVRTACDDIASEVACNDDASGGTLSSEVTFFVEAGVEYFLVADTYDREEVSPFTLTLSVGEPPEALMPPGMWVTRGYGIVLETTDTEYTLYEYASEYCLIAGTGPIFELNSFFAEVESTDELLRVRVAGSIGWTEGDAIDNLPAVCSTLEPSVGDAGYSFDAIRHLEIVADMFATHYPFFELRGLDWNEMVTEARAALGDDATEEELESVLLDLLRPLDDGHVSLTTPRGSTESGPFEAIAILQREFEAQDDVGDFDEYVDREFTRYLTAIETRLSDASGEYDGLRWGRIGDIGYVRAFGFDFNAAEMSEAMDPVLSDLADVEALIVDVRVNTGGSDTASLEMASRFTASEVPVLVKAPYLGPGEFGPETAASVPACDEGACFDVPVILLASESTVSAGEIFVMAMRELPNVEIWGEPTSGELSDILSRELPNGWSIGMSHERYLTAGGELFEMVGIPPDVELDGEAFSQEAREAGEDPWLDAAIDALS